MSDKLSDILCRFLLGCGDPWEFDDFISSAQEGVLEQYRLELIELRDEYPPDDGNYCNMEGIERIKNIVLELKKIGQ